MMISNCITEDALNVACHWKEWDIVEELLQNGAEPTTVTFLKGRPLLIKVLNAADLL
jgi:ankyrin repeat protein